MNGSLDRVPIEYPKHADDMEMMAKKTKTTMMMAMKTTMIIVRMK